MPETIQSIKVVLMIIIAIEAFFCFIILLDRIETIIYYLQVLTNG